MSTTTSGVLDSELTQASNASFTKTLIVIAVEIRADMSKVTTFSPDAGRASVRVGGGIFFDLGGHMLDQITWCGHSISASDLLVAPPMLAKDRDIVTA